MKTKINLNPTVERTGKKRGVERMLRPSAWFTMPSVLIYTALFALPVIIAFVSSTTNWNGLSISPKNLQFIGIQNFTRMLSDGDLLNSIKVTFLITFIVAIVVNIGGLCIALMLDRTGKMTSVMRSFFFIPYVMSSVSIAFIWMAILSYNGLLNNLLDILQLDKLNLFQNSQSAIGCICVVEIWRTLGFYMVLYIAALQGVPHELVEACMLDGGGKWATFWHVKFPLILPQLLTGVMMSITTEMRLYDLVYILTNGGPGTSTRTVAYSIVTQGFSNWRMGYAGAIAVVLSIIIIIMTAISRKLQNAAEVDQ